jgi:hypothetical protein
MTTGPQLKIFRSIVVTNSIFVMDRFVRLQFAAQHALHLNAMFVHLRIFSRPLKNSVTVSIDCSTFRTARNVDTRCRAILLVVIIPVTARSVVTQQRREISPTHRTILPWRRIALATIFALSCHRRPCNSSITEYAAFRAAPAGSSIKPGRSGNDHVAPALPRPCGFGGFMSDTKIFAPAS